MSTPYEDILYLPHHVSDNRARMSMLDRAAQFSPFAALTGYDDVVSETARLTQTQIILDVDAREELDKKLTLIRDQIAQGPQLRITHFVPDERKAGGAYVTTTGRGYRMSSHEKWLKLDDGTAIFFENILNIESDIFRDLP